MLEELSDNKFAEMILLSFIYSKSYISMLNVKNYAYTKDYTIGNTIRNGMEFHSKFHAQR